MRESSLRGRNDDLALACREVPEGVYGAARDWRGAAEDLWRLARSLCRDGETAGGQGVQRDAEPTNTSDERAVSASEGVVTSSKQYNRGQATQGAYLTN